MQIDSESELIQSGEGPQAEPVDLRHGFRRKTDQANSPEQRLKQVAGALYECNSGDSACRYRFSFGLRYFCSWMLDDGQDGSGRLPPCFSN